MHHGKFAAFHQIFMIISIICELTAAYIITKVSLDSKIDNNCKIPMDCSKFHAMHSMRIGFHEFQ